MITMLIAMFVSFPLSLGGYFAFFNLLLVFGILLFLFCLQISYLRLMQILVVAFIFLPVHYVPALSLFKFINPLTFLGGVLIVKSFFDKIMLNKGPWCQKLENIDKVYFFFLVSVSISTFFAISKLGAINWIFASIVIGYVPYKVVRNLEREELIRLIRTLVIMGALCAVEGLWEYFSKHSILMRSSPERLTSLLGYPLASGLLFAIMFPYSLFLYSSTKERKFIACAAAFFIAIILTQARGSWIALMTGVLFVLPLVPVKEKIRLIVVGVMVFATIAAVPLLRHTIDSRIHEREVQRYSSWDIRFRSIPVALRIIEDKPLFGGGPFNAGRFKNTFATNKIIRNTTFENAYLGFLVDYGIIGCILLFSIFIMVLRRLILTPQSRIYYGRVKFFALWSILTMFMNFVTFNFDEFRAFSFVLWFFMGIAIALTSFKALPPDKEIS